MADTDEAQAKARAKRKAQTRAAFLRQTLRWHWISAAVCLVGMLLFAITGITLNNASLIPATPKTTERSGVIPEPLRGPLQAAEASSGELPAETRKWLREELKVKAPAGPVEWSPGEAYISLAGPGADAGLTIDTATGEAMYERTDRGPIAYLNDLHKGRDTGVAWKWFLDIFAIGCVVFCITGLILLQLHSWARKSTWPLVGAGLVIPLMLALFFIH